MLKQPVKVNYEAGLLWKSLSRYDLICGKVLITQLWLDVKKEMMYFQIKDPELQIVVTYSGKCESFEEPGWPPDEYIMFKIYAKSTKPVKWEPSKRLFASWEFRLNAHESQ